MVLSVNPAQGRENITTYAYTLLCDQKLEVTVLTRFTCLHSPSRAQEKLLGRVTNIDAVEYC